MEHRFTEIRAEGRRLAGTVVRYGDVAVVGGVPEKFAPGSLLCKDVVLNRQHERGRPLARTGGGGLLLKDGPERLEMEAVLPETVEATDTLALVRSGILPGLSAEFEVLSEHDEDGCRVIDLANLSGLAVVDRPAFQQSTVEARARKRGLRGTIPYNQTETVRSTGRVRKERIAPGAFGYSLSDPDQEILAQIGNAPAEVLGSKKAGSLKLTDSPSSLGVEIANVVSTSYADDFLAQLGSGLFDLGLKPLYRTEGVADAFVDVPEPGNPDVSIREIKNAVLYAVSFVHRKRKGDSSAVERREMRRVWL